ncbi:MAG: hypothetical protein IIY78_01640 [Clostridia bacterium]|nr:hypothetical protein [Clostridia bacterium]
MIDHAKAILNLNGNREDGIERLARASCHAINKASIRPCNEEYKKAQDKIVLALRDIMKKTGRNLLDEKEQICISVSCCVAYKVNVEIVPENCKVDLKE